MVLVDYIALSGALVAAAISLPQFLLVVRTRDTAGLALTTWILNGATAIGWLGHGIRVGEINMIWPNAWSLCVTSTVLYFLHRNGAYKHVWQLWWGPAFGALLLGLDAVMGSTAWGLAIMVPQVFAIIRQGIMLMRAPRVSGVSPMAWFFQSLCQAIWMTWGLMTGESGTFIVSAISLVAALYVLIWRLLRMAGLGPIGVHRGEEPGGVGGGDVGEHGDDGPPGGVDEDLGEAARTVPGPGGNTQALDAVVRDDGDRAGEAPGA